MRNDDLTKLARWIVPGWLTFLTFLGFILLDLLITPSSGKAIFTKNDIANTIQFFNENQIPSSSEALFVTLLGVAAGVPVGFIVYQIYFFLRWNSPFSRDGFLSLIPGRRRDIQKSTQDMHEELAFSDEWRKDIINHALYKADHSFKYRYVESLFIEACQELDKGTEVSVFSRHRYLHEVVHTLGASIGALYVGFFGYLALRLLKEDLNASIYLPVVFFLIITFFGLMYKEDEWRTLKATDIKNGKVLDSLAEPPILHIDLNKLLVGFSFPSSQLLLTFIFLHFFGNPRFSPPAIPDFIHLITSNYFSTALAVFLELIQSKLWLRLFLTFAVLGVWVVLSQGKSNRRFLMGSLVWATLTVIGCLLLIFYTDWFNSWIDWTFFFVFTVFLIATLILFSNRRNASDDMLLLEYYTMRRFLDKRPKSKKSIGTHPVRKQKEKANQKRS